MKAITKVLASGGFIAALAIATPAAAQYNPYGYGSGNILGQVIQSVIGGGYGGGYGSGYGGYQVNSQALVNQCANAVQARLNGGGAGYGGYGYASQYGYAGGARVLGISRVEQRSGGGVTVRGVASSGANAYAYGGYAGQQQQRVDLTWKCKTDYRGMIADIDIDRAQTNYGYNQPYNQGYSQSYTPYDYSQYGYRRY